MASSPASGRTYDYFMCPKRYNDKVHCPQRLVRVERIEIGVEALFERIQLL